MGGKTGVNHPLGKNMIGAFYQPRRVIIDTATLATLPARELSAGLAEVIKYGLINDAPFFDWLEANIETVMSLQPDAVAEVISRSCINKATIVERDEQESGVRALLNLGHTFGHAMETATGYGRWLHGEAVGIGMVMAAHLSHALGWLKDADVERTTALIRRAGLPWEPFSGVDPGEMRKLMQADKKVLSGRLRLILLREIGTAEIVDEVDEAMLGKIIRHFCGGG